MLLRLILILFLISLTGCEKPELKTPASPPRISPGMPQRWDVGDYLIEHPLPDDADDFYLQFSKAPGYSFGMVRAHKVISARSHEEHDLLIYVFNGNARFHVGEKDYLTSTGDIIYVPRGAVYSAESINDQRLDFITVFHPIFDGDDIFYHSARDQSNKK